MTTSLQRRLGALEAVHRGDAPVVFLIRIRYDGPGASLREVSTVSMMGQRLVRESTETETQFLARACDWAETQRSPGQRFVPVILSEND